MKLILRSLVLVISFASFSFAQDGAVGLGGVNPAAGGGSGGGAGTGSCTAGQVVTGVNTTAPTCTDNVTPGTVTASTPFTFSQTWNAGGVVFDALHINITGTAFADHSSLFQVTDTTNNSMYFSVQPEVTNPSHGRGMFVFNNGSDSIANSEDFAIHSLSNAVVFGDGSGNAGAVAVFANYLDAGSSWTNSATIRLGPDNLNLNQNSIIKWTDNDNFFNSIDTGLTRRGAGLVAVGNGTTGDFTGSLISTLVQTKTIFTVGTLPTCNGAAEGSRASVSDANTPVFLANVIGTGAVHIGVYCNGTNWIVQ